MTETCQMRPCAIWTNDCQGKKNFDGRLLDICTRYWPGPSGGGTMTFDAGIGAFGALPYGPRPSAHSSIHLLHGEPKNGEYLVWREEKFDAETEAEVRALVEAWVTQQISDLIMLLGGRGAFKEP